ncbi:NADase-type glycan-binding domain-containing protein [Olivibacter sitiensis]|uniref:NADase-type glycan-binding domain-containing protein n=1 Tax=Olivibacter sitiensis TaxID=376470 RepID=UPI00040839C9|nr:hypothetical protein [Olivibacter sitiensis]
MDKRIVHFIVFLLGTSACLWAQSPKGIPELKPSKVLKFDFGEEQLAFWSEAESYMAIQLESGKDIYSPSFYEKANEREKTFLDSLESGDSPYNTDHRSRYWGNNWPYATDLIRQEEEYPAYDFSLATQWLSRTGTDGVGEKITYIFEPAGDSEIREVLFFPGNMRTAIEWQKYSRPAKVKLRINDTEIAILCLNDENAGQVFEIPMTASYLEGMHIVVECEILSVYPGSEFKESAISEINFNGTNIL